MDSTQVNSRDGEMTRRSMLGLLGCGSVALAAASTAREAVAAPGCKVISGTQQDTLITDGCTSPVGFCTTGTFRGKLGFKGVSSFSALAFDPIPSDPLGRLAISANTTYTTKDSQIAVSDVLVFDPTRGTFAGIGSITSGTGEFAGATGEVFTYGHVSADGQTFTRSFVIEICL